mmetsp:Transcript_22399/g.63976  ORF Transcript_22399/g.63976 Transcript_22399/m.63976 type:complete len:277 (-) Transcript_22399:67-897(-)
MMPARTRGVSPGSTSCSLSGGDSLTQHSRSTCSRPSMLPWSPSRPPQAPPPPRPPRPSHRCPPHPPAYRRPAAPSPRHPCTCTGSCRNQMHPLGPAHPAGVWRRPRRPLGRWPFRGRCQEGSANSARCTRATSCCATPAPTFSSVNTEEYSYATQTTTRCVASSRPPTSASSSLDGAVSAAGLPLTATTPRAPPRTCRDGTRRATATTHTQTTRLMAVVAMSGPTSRGGDTWMDGWMAERARRGGLFCRHKRRDDEGWKGRKEDGPFLVDRSIGGC